MTYRVTKIICPSCHGSGTSTMFPGGPCSWCNGLKRISAEDAEAYATYRYSLSQGSRLVGAAEPTYVKRLEDEARNIFALLQRQPTWEREKAA